MTRTLIWAAVMVACAGLIEPAAASAQTDEAAARQHFRLGQAYYENGQFAEAAREFESAYRMSGRARLLYNAYLAYRDMQDLPNSARTLRQFLAESTDIESAERDQLQARLAAIDAAIARQQTSMPAETPTQTETQASQDPVAGETSATATATVQPGSGGGGGFNPSPVGFIVGGVGVALGIAAIITGVMASSDYSLLESECPGGMCPDRQDLRDAQSRGSTLAVLTDVFWVTGVVALAAGVTLIFVLQEGGGESTTAGVSCTPEGCYGAVQSRF